MWLVTLASVFLYFVIGLIGGVHWYFFLVYVLALILLLHPSTRSFYRRRQAVEDTRNSWST
jgi:hypothetical protein